MEHALEAPATAMPGTNDFQYCNQDLEVPGPDPLPPTGGGSCGATTIGESPGTTDDTAYGTE